MTLTRPASFHRRATRVFSPRPSKRSNATVGMPLAPPSWKPSRSRGLRLGQKDLIGCPPASFVGSAGGNRRAAARAARNDLSTRGLSIASAASRRRTAVRIRERSRPASGCKRAHRGREQRSFTRPRTVRRSMRTGVDAVDMRSLIRACGANPPGRPATYLKWSSSTTPSRATIAPAGRCPLVTAP